MRRPTKQPPPPPPPPKQRGSPRINSSLFLPTSHQYPESLIGGSEYAPSVCSNPTSLRSFRSVQNQSPSIIKQLCCPPVRNVCCGSPCSCLSSCRPAIVPCQQLCCSVQPICQAHTPCTPVSSRNRLDLSCGCVEPRRPPNRLPPGVPSTANSQPVPRERTSLPKLLSRSPLPVLKNKTNHSETKSHERCKPLYYKRHMEQHVERIFKYLREREERCRNANIDLSNNPTVSKETVLKLLAEKERLHLRSMRTRISVDDFEFIDRLGAGFIGNVSLVKKKTRGNGSNEGQLYAMKRLKKSQVFQQNHMAHVMAERDILAEADNEWIVKLYYSFQDIQYLYFILEYIPGGDMMNLLQKANVFSEDWARFYIAEISLALQFVHDMGFIHRDIKPDNILIDARGHIKLTDFGLCTGFRWTHDSSYYREDKLDGIVRQTEQMKISNGHNGFNDIHPTITTALTKRTLEHAQRKRSLSLVGSPNYIAPEVLRQAYLSYQENTNERLCDWWSVGVILYEMVIGVCPFIDLEKLAKAYDTKTNWDVGEDPPERIQRRILEWPKFLTLPGDRHAKTPVRDQIIQNDTESLIRGLLRDPEDRLCRNGLRDIQDHPFFKGINWERIRHTKAPVEPEINSPTDTTNFQYGQPPQMLDLDHHSMTLSTNTKMITDWTYNSFWSKPAASAEP